jgi:hypothetical protein
MKSPNCSQSVVCMGGGKLEAFRADHRHEQIGEQSEGEQAGENRFHERLEVEA